MKLRTNTDSSSTNWREHDSVIIAGLLTSPQPGRSKDLNLWEYGSSTILKQVEDP